MIGYNFTERVRKVLALARDEAGDLRHEYIGTEHILLGLMREGQGAAVAVLQNLSVDISEIRQMIDHTLTPGKADTLMARDLPFTSRARKVLELAMAEARDLAHNYVGTEHLLLGLLREEQGIAAQVLAHSGLTQEMARGEVRRFLEAEGKPRRTSSSSDVVAVTVEMRFANGSLLRENFRSVAAAIGFLNKQ